MFVVFISYLLLHVPIHVLLLCTTMSFITWIGYLTFRASSLTSFRFVFFQVVSAFGSWSQSTRGPPSPGLTVAVVAASD